MLTLVFYALVQELMACSDPWEANLCALMVGFCNSELEACVTCISAQIPIWQYFKGETRNWPFLN